MRAQATNEQLRDLKDRIANDVRTSWLNAITAYNRIGVVAAVCRPDQSRLQLVADPLQPGTEFHRGAKPGATAADGSANSVCRRQISVPDRAVGAAIPDRRALILWLGLAAIEKKKRRSGMSERRRGTILDAFGIAAIAGVLAAAVVEDLRYFAEGSPESFLHTWHIQPVSMFVGSLVFMAMLYLLQLLNDRERALKYVYPYVPLVLFPEPIWPSG